MGGPESGAYYYRDCIDGTVALRHACARQGMITQNATLVIW
jgi:hypothetical protein